MYRMASDVASLGDHVKELVNPIFVELRTALKVTDPKLFGETYASPPRTPHTPATTPSFQIIHSAICCDKKSCKIQRTHERAKREATAQSRVYLRPAFDVLWIRVAQRLCCIELGQRARFFWPPATRQKKLPRRRRDADRNCSASRAKSSPPLRI